MENANKKGRKARSKDFDSVFASRLRKLLSERETTQQQLSEGITATRQAINKWVNGETVPDVIAAAEIARYFDVSVDYLLGLTDVPSTDEDIKNACKVTGLSNKTVEFLSALQTGRRAHLAFLNLFIKKLPVLFGFMTERYCIAKKSRELFEAEYFKEFCKVYGINEDDKEVQNGLFPGLEEDEIGFDYFYSIKLNGFRNIFLNFGNFSSLTQELNIRDAITGAVSFALDKNYDEDYEVYRMEKVLTECYSEIIDNIYADCIDNETQKELSEYFNDIIKKVGVEDPNNAQHNTEEE